ncbi:glycosyltransferase [Candidatus Kaiserbacteria bacterium]|nr:glycosyltransferase [Candidatus Kaiserbacteria bacterium]
MPNSGIKKKKSAAMAILNVWATSRVVESARRARITLRFSYNPAIKKTPTHTTKRSEKGARCERNTSHNGASKARKKSETHRASIRESRSPKKRTRVRGRKVVAISVILLYNKAVKKKVTFVITKANWGGAQRYVFDLATALQNDFDVQVAFGQEGLLAKKLHEAGITTSPIRALQRDVSLSADVKSFFELYRLFKKERPDVVHLNSSKAGGVGALAARLAGIKKIIFTVHGLPEDEARSAVGKILIQLATRLTVALCDTIITISKNNHDRVHGSVLIYNGIAPMQFGSGEIIRNAFPVGVHITGTVGELTKNKNQAALIELAKRNQAMYVAIVGEGEDRAMLEQKIKEYGLEARVKLFGFMPAAEVLKGFDTFALPSIKEGLPYVLLEAKHAGLPIVANRVGGVGEILDAPDMSDFTLQKMVQKTAALY